MKQQRLKEPVAQEAKPAPVSETDYRPRTSSSKDQLVFGLKLAAVIGIALLALWLYEGYVVM
ncbi:MAG: hypothetical protein RBR20_14390 [Desulfobacterales bacterium]|jgi:hypothetical protein|nr:hypothetical protein [Desulfobacteraceae bacterium]MDY0313302.1 hypothetical protein [Desulfobacterales bacterium]